MIYTKLNKREFQKITLLSNDEMRVFEKAVKIEEQVDYDIDRKQFTAEKKEYYLKELRKLQDEMLIIRENFENNTLGFLIKGFFLWIVVLGAITWFFFGAKYLFFIFLIYYINNKANWEFRMGNIQNIRNSLAILFIEVKFQKTFKQRDS